jgi:hypothetical protein
MRRLGRKREAINVDVHNSGYERNALDLYIEPRWCFGALIDVLGAADFARGVYDPACGIGTIPVAAKALGLSSFGSDIIERPKLGPFQFGVRDFTAEPTGTGVWPAVVMNPPFQHAQAFIEKALRETKRGGIVAALTPASFLYSQARHSFFRAPETERIIFLSKRPSMPDGDALLAGEVTRGGGKANYNWLIFRAGGRAGGAAVANWWMPANSSSPPSPPAPISLGDPRLRGAVT